MMDGYEDFTTPVEIKANQAMDSGKLRLVRSTGWLDVSTTPPARRSRSKGRMSRSRHALHHPWTSEKLPAGDYEGGRGGGLAADRPQRVDRARQSQQSRWT